MRVLVVVDYQTGDVKNGKADYSSNTFAVVNNLANYGYKSDVIYVLDDTVSATQKVQYEKGKFLTADLIQDLGIKMKTLTTQHSYDGIVCLGFQGFLALGNAAGSLNAKPTQTQYRGSVLETYKGLPTLSTFGDATVWKVPDRVGIRNTDLGKFISRLRLGKATEYDIQVVYTEENLNALIERIENSKVIGYDLETLFGVISCIGIGMKDSRNKISAYSVPLFLSNGINIGIDALERFLETLKRFHLDSKKRTLIQNATFDVGIVRKHLGYTILNYEDTMLQAHNICQDAPKDLGYLVSLHTDQPYHKSEGKTFFSGKSAALLSATSMENFYRYNAKDAAVLIPIHDKQFDKIMNNGNLEAYRAQLKLVVPCIQMQENGFKYDEEKRQLWTQKYRQISDKYGARIKARGIVNPSAPMQIMHYLNSLGYFPVDKSDKPSSGEIALQNLGRTYPDIKPFVDDLLTYRGAEKILTTYLNVLTLGGRFISSFNPGGTTTGRFSSGMVFGYGGNLQNQPYEMKELLLVDDGMVMFNIDLSQAENRVVAYICNDENMKSAFEKGIDIHSLTASYIFGGDPTKEVQDNIYPDIAGGSHPNRFWGKKANHSLNYGMGPATFAMTLSISVEEARYIVTRYKQAYPQLTDWHIATQRAFRDNGFISNLFGKRFYSKDRHRQGMFTDLYAFSPQSSIADWLNKQGLLYLSSLQEELGTENFMLMNQVHDALVFQVSKSLPVSQQQAILQELVNRLSQPIDLGYTSFSIPCDISVYTENAKKSISYEDYFRTNQIAE